MQRHADILRGYGAYVMCNSTCMGVVVSQAKLSRMMDCAVGTTIAVRVTVQVGQSALSTVCRSTAQMIAVFWHTVCEYTATGFTLGQKVRKFGDSLPCLRHQECIQLHFGYSLGQVTHASQPSVETK